MMKKLISGLALALSGILLLAPVAFAASVKSDHDSDDTGASTKTNMRGSTRSTANFLPVPGHINTRSRLAAPMFRVMNGIVTANNASSLTATFERFGALTVLFNPGVIIQDINGGALNISDVLAGHRIQVRGIFDAVKGTITASQIIDVSLPATSPSPSPSPTP